nr:monocarboxylate transporter 9-like [Parasteatoda tepidariorum]
METPDGARAWLIAGAACVINMLLSGLSRMVGILYMAIMSNYYVSRSEAALPFVVRNSIRMLMGPLVGIVGQTYGIRTVTFCGGMLAAAGAALCCFAPNVLWLAIFWGGLHGKVCL